MKNTQVEFFNKWAQKYLLNRVPQYKFLLDSMYGAVSQYVKPGDVKNLADLGTGTGICAILSYKNFENLEKITAVDVSNEMLNGLVSRWDEYKFDKNKLEVVLSDFEDLKLEKNKYDFVVASFSLHHVPHERKQKMLEEINKIMSKGGILLVGETMFESQGNPLSIAFVYAKKALNGLRFVGVSQFFREVDFYFKIIKKQGEYMATKDMWVDKLQKSGFEVLESKFTSPKLTYGYIIARKK